MQTKEQNVPSPDEAFVAEAIAGKLSRLFGVRADEASAKQVFAATALTVRDILSDRRHAFRERSKKSAAKRVYYLSMEFLVGCSLKNDLANLGLSAVFSDALSSLGYSLDELAELERDPGLGSGGLGRLAACYMDALTSGGYDAVGYSICYEYGYFTQKIVDGNQIELPDRWLDECSFRLIPRTDRAFDVTIGGKVRENWDESGHHTEIDGGERVRAVAYDMLVSGHDTPAVNLLRLWRAFDTRGFDMKLFSQGEYVRAMAKESGGEVISKVLYPSDDHVEGKLLRLTQQYFLVSASLQNILAEHVARHGSLDTLPEYAAIHINDTHPALAVAELMRLLLDEHSFAWDDAWRVVCGCISYTNHTVMPEALECWNEDLFALRLPRVHSIAREINERYCADLWRVFPGEWERISRMAIISSGQIKMANLCLAAAHTVNGVSELHSQILKDSVFHDAYKAFPEKFTNVTNGIAYRRWLCLANADLAALLDDLIGSSYRRDASRLAELSAFAEDSRVLDELTQIKANNKRRFAAYFHEKTGEALDPEAFFDVQVKRIHEYKRQMLNVLKIVALYLDLQNGANVVPATFIFGGKAAPGYYIAKETIRLIWALGEQLRSDRRSRDVLRVVFLENYDVSESEKLIPAADLSEQISLAGKEASGTGCMKFMINGAPTIGTLDGANVEIARHAGAENEFIFGMTAPEVDELWKRGYDSSSFIRKSERLAGVIEALRCGFNGVSFESSANYLVGGAPVADPYMCAADFDSYFDSYSRARETYSDGAKWAKMSLHNIAGAGFFSADRAIAQYAERIWRAAPVEKARTDV